MAGLGEISDINFYQGHGRAFVVLHSTKRLRSLRSAGEYPLHSGYARRIYANLGLSFRWLMAAGAALLVAAVLFVHGADSSTPPKFIKAAYGVQKALYAKDYGYSLVPIPARILKQAYPPKTLPLVGAVPEISARQGRAYKYYRGRSSSRRRRKRPPTYRKRPSSYGVPVYATKYKNYLPSRRPPSIPPIYSRYKKKRRPYRGPPRRPTPYREVPPEFDDYEQEIPTDDYEDYETGDDYPYFDIPSKRLPLEYDKEFLNRHADLYNRGYNPVGPRGRYRDVIGQYTDQVKTRVRFQPPKEEHHDHHDHHDPHEHHVEHHVEHPEKHEESQENLWPGEVSSVHTNLWQDSSNVHKEPHSWGEEPHSWGEEPHTQNSWQDTSHEWNNPRPPRQDNQWQVYQPQQQQHQSYQPQQHFQWPPRPTRAQDLRGWTTSLRPKAQAAAVNHPSRPVVSREQDTSSSSSTRQVYNWDPVSHTYQLVETDNRPRYQAHYSAADFNYSTLDRKSTESKRSHRAIEPDIGFGEGMEVVDDGVAGWKVKK